MHLTAANLNTAIDRCALGQANRVVQVTKCGTPRMPAHRHDVSQALDSDCCSAMGIFLEPRRASPHTSVIGEIATPGLVTGPFGSPPLEHPSCWLEFEATAPDAHQHGGVIDESSTLPGRSRFRTGGRKIHAND